MQKLIHHPLLQEEKELLYSTGVEKIKSTIVDNNSDIEKEDILWISRDGESFQSISYEKPRKVLNFVCEFPERFSTQDEVFTLFLKAQFTGRLLDVARVMESTFGLGSFRVLGDMEPTSNSATKTYELLRKTLQK